MTNAIGHPHISDHSGDQAKSRRWLRGGLAGCNFYIIFRTSHLIEPSMFTHSQYFFPSNIFLLFFICSSLPSNKIFSFSKYFPHFVLCFPPPFLFLPPFNSPKQTIKVLVFFVPWSMPIWFREVHLEHQKPRAGSWGGRWWCFSCLVILKWADSRI